MIGLAAELIYEQSTLGGYYFSTAYTFIFLSKIIHTYTGTMRWDPVKLRKDNARI